MTDLDKKINDIAQSELTLIRKEIARLNERSSEIQRSLEVFQSILKNSAVCHIAATTEASTHVTLGEPSKEEALKACVSHVGLHGPSKTKTLLAVLRTAGIEIGGVNPANALSSVLSRSGRFTADRKLGWNLKT